MFTFAPPSIAAEKLGFHLGRPASFLSRVKSACRARIERFLVHDRLLEEQLRHSVEQLERLSKLKEFLSPSLVEAIDREGDEILRAHPCEVAVVFIDLRNFTAFTDRAQPEEVIEMLRGFHAAMGREVVSHGGTLERFAGDSLMVFFNDPQPIERPAERAVRMSVAMQQAFRPIAEAWGMRGHELGLGCGIAQGVAIVGAIGFEGRWDYAAVGKVTNLAARLCAQALPNQILVDSKTLSGVDGLVEVVPVGPLVLKGFADPVPAFSVLGICKCAGSG